MGAEKYGRYYWCIRTNASPAGRMFVFADEAVVMADGSLCLFKETAKNGKPARLINMAFPRGSWTAIFAASVIDGHEVAVEHWE